MINRATCIWMVLAIVAGIGLFLLKYEVKGMEENLAVLNSQTLQNLESVHVLKAEWSYLNQPGRLADLGQRLLEMESADVLQTAKITDLPMRPNILVSNSDGLNNPNISRNEGALPLAAGQVSPDFATYRREQ